MQMCISKLEFTLADSCDCDSGLVSSVVTPAALSDTSSIPYTTAFPMGDPNGNITLDVSSVKNITTILYILQVHQ